MVFKNSRSAWARYWRDLVVNSLASPLVPVPARWRALRLLGADVGRSFVSPHVTFGSMPRLKIGKGAYIKCGVMVDGPGAIEIGSSCSISARVLFITSTHEIGGSGRRAGELRSSPISVGDGSWIGAGAIILPGVRIGAGCVIGAGAVVTGNCAPNSVYAGVPARLIRTLE